MGEARRIRIVTVYEGKDISGEINGYLESMSYHDSASGESDSISLELRNDDKVWLEGWYPQKGDRIQSSIIFLNWDGTEERRLDCGNFLVDEVSFSGRPLEAVIGAAAIPQDTAFNTENRSKTWESVTIRQIALEIAERAGIELFYEADNINIQALEQDEQTDCKFLYALCEDYGLAMKVFNNRIVIFDEEKYEQKAPSVTIRENDMLKWDINTTMAGTYTGAVFSFSDPNDEQEYSVEIGSRERVLNINVTASSLYDAERKAVAKLNQENKKATTITAVIMADPGIVSGMNVRIEGMGRLSGKYYVEKVSTRITGGSGSQMTLSLRQITERIKNHPVSPVSAVQYTVKSGDTLWALAKKFLGDARRYTEIYEDNKAVIEETAKKHGKTNSKSGHWIWPGTVLMIRAAKEEGD